MMDWLIDSSEFSYGLVVFACRALIHSTLLLGIALLMVKALGMGRAPLRSAILRCALLTVLVCPWLGNLGMPSLAHVYLPLGSPVYSYAASQQQQAPQPAGQSPAWAVDQATAKLRETALTAAKSWESAEPQSVIPRQSRTDVFSNSLVVSYGVLALGWITVTLLLLIRLAWAYTQTWRLRKQADPAPEVLTATCHRIANKLNIGVPRLGISSDVQSPVLVGFLRPTILLPPSFSHAENTQILIHELAHLKRRDCLWNVISQLIALIYFFQPLLWTLIRCLQDINEEVCDRYVLFHTRRRTHYAHRLVALAEQHGHSPPLKMAAIGVVGFKSSLGRRVERILNTNDSASVRIPMHAQTLVYATGLLVMLSTCMVTIQAANLGHRERWQAFQSSDAQIAKGQSDHLSENQIQTLIEAISSSDGEERARVMEQLGNADIATHTVVPLLIKGLEDPEWLVRKAAAQALGRKGAEAQSALIPLIRALNDSQWIVRESSAYALGAVSVNNPPVKELRAALEDPQWHVRKTAATALTGFGQAAAPAVAPLTRALQDPEWHVRKPAAQALAAVGPQAHPAVSKLMEALADEEWQVRSCAAKALASIRTKASPAVAQLTAALSDVEWQVRRPAALALGAIGPEAASAIPTLIKCLDDPEWHCRHAAALALEKTAQGDEAAIPNIIDALLDPEWNMRQGVALSLQKNLL
jgi:HEAT repeat protein